MTRTELLDYVVLLPAAQLPPNINGPVWVLVRSIQQAREQAAQALASVKSVMACIDAAAELEEVPNLAHYAVDYERAQESLTRLFLTLAAVLKSHGHKIDF